VKQLVQMPFQFNLSKPAWERAAAAGQGPVVAGYVVSTARAGNDSDTVRRLAPVRAIATRRPNTTSAPTPVSDSMRYSDFQVEEMARPLPGNSAPKYPDVLRKSNVDGEVVVQFVVDTSGTADLTSLKVLRSTDAAFTQAVREALATYRFAPAQVGGRRVKQLMQMPFTFSLSKH
jgi:TonB family protein